MSLQTRRRLMMAKKADKPAALVPGVYHSDQDQVITSTVDANGTISGEKVCYFITIPFSRAIPYSAGDVIRLAQDRAYSSLTYFRTVSLNGSGDIVIVNNKLMGNYASFTFTATEDGYMDAIHYDNSTAGQNATVKPLIYINDELVLGG